MHRFKKICSRIALSVLSVVLAVSIPAAALASEVPTSSDSLPVTVAGVADTAPAGVDRPTGSAAKTFIYNPASGLWENQYYTWNPTTHETRALYDAEYTYNPLTGLWDTPVWEYSPASDRYNQTILSVGQPPAGAVTHGMPAETPTQSLPVSSDVSGSAAGAAYAAPATPESTPATTPPMPPAQSPTLDTAAAATIQNSLTSDAQTGAVTLQGTLHAGDAQSGSAQAVATVLNLLQSSSSLGGANVATFSRDIRGDVTGTILINPAALVQPAAVDLSQPTDIHVSSQADGSITNDITLHAGTGDVSLIDNTHAGSATSGNALAVANVMNLINSVVAANQSFVGVINIYGNLVGDILVPQDTLNALLAGNEPAEPSDESALGAPIDQEIQNNITLAATSGDVRLDGNTHAGNGRSGNALTRLTILNLTGHAVTAENSLLVFVNVLGTWVGVIMDAPAGTTAAALTGGAADTMIDTPVLSTGVGMLPGSAQLAGTQSITNNIRVSADSGDVMARGNYSVQDATSGSATASANVLNLLNSSLSLSHWFGVLFINVFGSWHGNFGAVQPESTQPDTPAGGDSGAAAAGTTAPARPQTTGVRIFRFQPTPGGRTSSLRSVRAASFPSRQTYEEYVEQVTEVLAAENVPEQVNEWVPGPTREQPFSLAALPIVLGITGLTAVSADRIRSTRRRVIHYAVRSLRR